VPCSPECYFLCFNPSACLLLLSPGLTPLQLTERLMGEVRQLMRKHVESEMK
jgi:hypothetical protein